MGGFGQVMLATFTLANRSERPAKDIKIECTPSAPSGTHLNTLSTTVYETIPPKGQVTTKELNLGFMNEQAKSASCRVVDVAVQ